MLKVSKNKVQLSKKVSNIVSTNSCWYLNGRMPLMAIHLKGKKNINYTTNYINTIICCKL